MSRPRWALHAEASTWRFLMSIGMYMHTYGGSIPPPAAFKRTIRTTIAAHKGFIDLYFYTPKNYPNIMRPEHEKGYPVVLAFHGGGFTIGTATDDCRWADAVNSQVDAVVVCVEYRLAPEYPFPTAVEDGVDAIFYLVEHAAELNIDPSRLCISGFSAGGNMAFTVPLRWQYELRRRSGIPTDIEHGHSKLPQNAASEGAYTNSDTGGKIIAICAFYPPVDYTHSREERRMTNKRPDKEMPKFFTDLFDASYLYPPINIDRSSPYLSPGVAPSEMLRGLPEDIIMYTCEWDELAAEGDRFQKRLREELGKNVVHCEVEGVGHAWDKSPTSRNPKTDVIYKEACDELRRVLYHSREGLGEECGNKVKHARTLQRLASSQRIPLHRIASSQRMPSFIKDKAAEKEVKAIEKQREAAEAESKANELARKSVDESKLQVPT